MSPTPGGYIFVRDESAIWQQRLTSARRSPDVQGSVNPVPRTVINHSSSAWTGYEVLMWMFGFVWGVVNMCVTWMLLAAAFAQSKTVTGILKFPWVTFLILVGIPIAILFTIMPFFGPWIVTAIVQRVSFQHLNVTALLTVTLIANMDTWMRQLSYDGYPGWQVCERR